MSISSLNTNIQKGIFWFKSRNFYKCWAHFIQTSFFFFYTDAVSKFVKIWTIGHGRRVLNCSYGPDWKFIYAVTFCFDYVITYLLLGSTPESFDFWYYILYLLLYIVLYLRSHVVWVISQQVQSVPSSMAALIKIRHRCVYI